VQSAFAVEECYSKQEWSRLIPLSHQYGTDGKITQIEIDFVLNHSIHEIIRRLED
jgi:hypothetical protein